MRNMGKILRHELEEIWKWLKSHLTSEEKQWLIENRHGAWEQHGKPEWAWGIRNAYALSFRIQDILDAKAGRTEITYNFAGGLPKSCLLEIAKMLNLDVSGKPQWKIVMAIIDEIITEQQSK